MCNASNRLLLVLIAFFLDILTALQLRYHMIYFSPMNTMMLLPALPRMVRMLSSYDIEHGRMARQAVRTYHPGKLLKYLVGCEALRFVDKEVSQQCVVRLAVPHFLFWLRR